MAELRKGIKWMLFFSSYVPLYPFLMWKHWGIKLIIPSYSIFESVNLSGIEIPIISIFWGLFLIISLALFFIVHSVRNSREGFFPKIKDYDTQSSVLTQYLLVYIFPFILLDFSEPINWVAFVVFFLLIGDLQIRHNQIHINPVLSWMGYEIYKVEGEDSEISVLLSTEPPNIGTPSIQAVKLSEDVYISV